MLMKYIVFHIVFFLLIAGGGPAKGQTDVFTITDIAGWKHPVKGVFQKHNVVLEKVELYKNKTYPLFYVKLPYDPHLGHNSKYFARLYTDLARANAYWDYELVSREDEARIKIYCDRKRKTVLREELIELNTP